MCSNVSFRYAHALQCEQSHSCFPLGPRFLCQMAPLAPIKSDNYSTAAVHHCKAGYCKDQSTYRQIHCNSGQSHADGKGKDNGEVEVGADHVTLHHTCCITPPSELRRVCNSSTSTLAKGCQSHVISALEAAGMTATDTTVSGKQDWRTSRPILNNQASAASHVGCAHELQQPWLSSLTPA